MRKLSSLVLVGVLVAGLAGARAPRARGQDKPADAPPADRPADKPAGTPKPADAPKPAERPAIAPKPADRPAMPPRRPMALPRPVEPPAPVSTKSLDEIKKEYADYSPAEHEFWDFLNEIGVMQKRAATVIEKLKAATAASQKDPKDMELKKKVDELQAEYKGISDVDQALGPTYQKRQQAHMEKLKAIYGEAGALTKAHPEDVKAETFWVKFMCEQGGFVEVQDEVAKLFADHPDDRDIRFLFGELCMSIPAPRHNPRDPRPAPEPRAPRFEKAYEVLAPIAKAEPDDKSVQLLFGVAACAIGKNAEAKTALDGVAAIGSIRPATRIVIGDVYDPDAAFKIWKDAADWLAEKPNDADLLKRRAELLVRCQAVPLAIQDAEAATKAKPDDREASILLARCFMYANSFDRAVKLFGDLFKNDEKDIDGRVEDGLALFSANRMQESRDVLGKVTREERATLPQKLQEALGNAHPEKLVDDWAAEEKARAEDAKRDDNPRVLLETDKGPVTIELFEDTAPNTVANFIYLAGNGFYDGVVFHRVISGFMAQGGDPAGTGLGGPDYTIKDEFDLKTNTRLHWRGTLSMAKAGAPNSGGSQFFLCFQPTPHLNGHHAVFGRVIEGQEVVDHIERGDLIVKAKVLRKRQHEYMPVKIAIPGMKAWEPGQPRDGDKKKPEKPADAKTPPEGEKKPDGAKPPEGEKR